MKKIRILFLFSVVGMLYSCIQEKDHGDQNQISIHPDYLDPYRPQMHYSRDTGWLSDPNGLYYLDGEWHLMFQGFSNRQGMYSGTNWDHAVSNDLLHWQHLPTVLPGGNQVSYYSGCAVVDNGVVWGFYTTHWMGEHPVKPNSNKISIARSEDNGKTWSYGNEHPIVNPEFPHERDPSVFWHEKSNKWIMATAGTGHIRFYSSENLSDWKFESKSLPYPSWECPDLTSMTVEETGEEKVLLITSTNGGVVNSTHGTCYHVGTFDGRRFLPEDTTDTRHWLDWGSDFYAGITYSNAPDDRVLFQSWFGWPCQINKVLSRTTKFSGTMNLIRQLSLHVDDTDNYYLKSNPIYEYKKLRRDSTIINDLNISGRKNIRENIGSHEPLEIILDASIAEGAVFGIRLKNEFGEDYLFQYDNWQRQFIGDRTNAGTVPGHLNNSYNKMARMPYIAKNDKLKLRIYWDVSTFEVFVDDGMEAFSQLLYPREPFSTMELFSFGGSTGIESLKIYDLNSIWMNR
jgi:fructan beta-fructosidase